MQWRAHEEQESFQGKHITKDGTGPRLWYVELPSFDFSTKKTKAKHRVMVIN